MAYRSFTFITGSFTGFLRCERGSATMEFVLWVPVFFFILVAATDATVLYLHHTVMWNVSRDVVRRISVGALTEAEAVDTVRNELFLYSRAYTVAMSNPSSLNTHITIQTRIADASVFGIFRPVMGRYLTASVTMRREPY